MKISGVHYIVAGEDLPMHSFVKLVDGKCFKATCTFVTCNHETGWYDSIKRWWGSQGIFVCLDCHTILNEKTMKRL